MLLPVAVHNAEGNEILRAIFDSAKVAAVPDNDKDRHSGNNCAEHPVLVIKG